MNCIVFLRQLWHGANVNKPDFPAMRAAMVSNQLRTNSIDDPRLIAALRDVPRERFVPEALAATAYADVPVPLGKGRQLNAPLVTARLLRIAEIRPGDIVLIIGAATGYAAAVAVALGAQVTAVEGDAELAARAQTSVDQATIVNSDPAQGHGEGAPYDVILIDGAVEQVPDALWAQLDEDGVLVTGVVEHGLTRLATGRRSGAGGVLVPFLEAEVAILPGFALPRTFSF